MTATSRGPWTAVKIGGSLIKTGELRRVLNGIASRPRDRLVVVPGGGVFADAVREAQAMAGLDDRVAHRLAIDSMAQMAAVFAALDRRFCPTTLRNDFDGILSRDRIPVWIPAELASGSAVAESWAMTSDSIAVWLGRSLRAERVVLIKSTEVDPEATAGALARAGIVDAAFPAMAEQFDGEITVLGPSRWQEVWAAEGVA